MGNFRHYCKQLLKMLKTPIVKKKFSNDLFDWCENSITNRLIYSESWEIQSLMKSHIELRTSMQSRFECPSVKQLYYIIFYIPRQ